MQLASSHGKYSKPRLGPPLFVQRSASGSKRLVNHVSTFAIFTAMSHSCISFSASKACAATPMNPSPPEGTGMASRQPSKYTPPLPFPLLLERWPPWSWSCLAPWPSRTDLPPLPSTTPFLTHPARSVAAPSQCLPASGSSFASPCGQIGARSRWSCRSWPSCSARTRPKDHTRLRG